jgi:branched-chain amino acid transport system ATP-binding protein
MRILEGEGVTKYFGGLAAVSNVDFHVQQGEILGLIGPNGAGKTTLFNLISAAIAPKSGIIRFKGEQINGLKPDQVCRKGVARTFQSVAVFANISILGNVMLGAMFGTDERISSAQATREAMQWLEFVGLAGKAHTPARDIILANQKRVEVARALATKPELLLLDELIAGLNPAETSEVMELVTRVRDKGITIVMIEHVMKAIMSICDRIIVLHHGEKIAEGKPQEIAKSKKVVELYLGE